MWNDNDDDSWADQRWQQPDDNETLAMKRLERMIRNDTFSNWDTGEIGPSKQVLERDNAKLKQQLAEAQHSAKTTKQFEFMQRIAIQAMEELERNELSDLVLLNNTELSKWWRKYKKDQQAEQARLQKIADKKLKEQQDAILKSEVLARLSTEEKRVLGIK